MNTLEVAMLNAMASLKWVSSAFESAVVQMGGNVSHLVGSSLVYLAKDAGDLGPVVPDSFLWLLVTLKLAQMVLAIKFVS